MAAPRVLVIRGGAIGDFILTLPAIRLLKEGIPNCHLEVLGYPGIADLALTAGLADHTRSLGHRHFAPLFAPGAPVQPEIADYLPFLSQNHQQGIQCFEDFPSDVPRDSRKDPEQHIRASTRRQRLRNKPYQT